MRMRSIFFSVLAWGVLVISAAQAEDKKLTEITVVADPWCPYIAINVSLAILL